MATKKLQKTPAKNTQSTQPSRQATLGWAVVWAVLGYVAISEAIDTASWWYYLAVCICGAQLIRCVKIMVQGHGK